MYSHEDVFEMYRICDEIFDEFKQQTGCKLRYKLKYNVLNVEGIDVPLQRLMPTRMMIYFQTRASYTLMDICRRKAIQNPKYRDNIMEDIEW